MFFLEVCFKQIFFIKSFMVIRSKTQNIFENTATAYFRPNCKRRQFVIVINVPLATALTCLSAIRSKIQLILSGKTKATKVTKKEEKNIDQGTTVNRPVEAKPEFTSLFNDLMGVKPAQPVQNDSSSEDEEIIIVPRR